MEGSIHSSSEKSFLFCCYDQGCRGDRGKPGDGFEVSRQLAAHGLTVVLTARDEKRGAEAVGKLRGLGLSDVACHQLELTDPASAARLAAFIRDKFGKLDVLVNNAGVLGVTTDVGDPATLQLADKDRMERVEWLRQRTTLTTDGAEDCLRTNYHGTKNVTEALLPLLQSSSDGRIVNVTSSFGLLRYFSSEELKQELDNIDNLTKQRLDEISTMYLEDFNHGTLESRGWPIDALYSPYKVSKALVCAYTRVLAKENAVLRVNCVHPGYVDTEMNCYTGGSHGRGGRSVSVAVALGEKGGVTGAYFDRTEVASFL